MLSSMENWGLNWIKGWVPPDVGETAEVYPKPGF